MDMKQKREELIDYALDTRNKGLFLLLSGPDYAVHITRYYGMEELPQYEALADKHAKETEMEQIQTNQELLKHLPVNPTRLFVQWIETNKYRYHKMIIHFLLSHPSFIDPSDPYSERHWGIVNQMMEQQKEKRDIVSYLESHLGEACASTFNRYVRNYQANHKNP